MVLTFEWVSACPLLFLLSTLRSAWLQAPYIYNNCVCVCFLLLLLLQQLNACVLFLTGQNPPSSAPLSSVKWL